MWVVRTGDKMRKKGRRSFWWWFSILLVALAAALIGYFFGMEKGRNKRDVLVSKDIPITEKKVPRVEQEIIPAKEETVPLTEEIEEKTLPDQKDYCRRIETDVREYFKYLDKKNYIQHLEAGIDTYDEFRKLLRKLSSRPPIPAGEGVDANIISMNIFHFFRLLNRKELRFVREIMRNEADTLEMNLELFYRWLMLGDRCPDPEEIRPSLDVLYPYAGFFMNSIGGRAYLFRRPLGLRLLIRYYCLLIIHEADKRGKNSYGIDMFPEIAPLAQEMGLYPDFHFQDEYLLQLTRLQNYYLKKR